MGATIVPFAAVGVDDGYNVSNCLQLLLAQRHLLPAACSVMQSLFVAPEVESLWGWLLYNASVMSILSYLLVLHLPYSQIYPQ